MSANLQTNLIATWFDHKGSVRKVWILSTVWFTSIYLRCGAMEIPESNIPITHVGTVPTSIEAWVAVGPFTYNPSPARPKEEVSLASTSVVAGKLQIFPSTGSADIRTVVATQKQLVDFNNLFALAKGQDNGVSVPSFLLFARLESDVARKVYLLIGSDGGVTIRLNGHPIFTESRVREYFEEYHTGTDLSLQAGSNLLEVEVRRVNTSCGLIARVTSSIEDAQSIALERNRCFVRHLLIDAGRPIEIKFGGAPKDSSLNVTVDGEVGSVLKSARVVADGAKLDVLDGRPDGIYLIRTEVGGKTYECALFKGDLDLYAGQLRSRLTRAGGTTKDQNNMATVVHRIDTLLAPDARRNANSEWERKIVYTLQEGMSACAALERGKNPWNESGLHIRAFVSPMDGAIRHYRIFVPSDHKPSSPLPLAIITATPTSAFRPFIDSAFIAHQFDAEEICAIAELHHMGVLWPGYPAEPYGNAAEFAHLESVLHAVGVDYAIDAERLYLLGTCRGGMIATMTAEAFPGRFAAIGLLNPIVDRRGNIRGQEVASADAATTRWIDGMDPLLHLNLLENISATVAFDEGDPKHGTIEDARLFLERAKHAGLTPEFHHVPLAMGHMEGWRALFDSIDGKRLSHRAMPQPGLLSNVQTTWGPITTAWSSGFVVVQGTVGSEKEREDCARLTDELCGAWNRRYYADCRRMLDVDIKKETEECFNLILVGNERTNAVWRTLAPKLNLETGPSSITINGRVVAMPAPQLNAVFRNPLYQTRRIVLLGGGQLDRIHLDAFDPATDGCYDLRVSPGATSSAAPLTIIDLGAASL